MEEKFEDIFRACYPPIVKYLQSAKQLDLHQAEDIASEAFLLMYQKWDSMTYHTKAAMYKWAALTANNILRNRQRKEQRRPLILSWEQDVTPSMMPQEDAAAYEMTEEAYEHCLASLMRVLTVPERELLTCKILHHAHEVRRRDCKYKHIRTLNYLIDVCAHVQSGRVQQYRLQI